MSLSARSNVLMVYGLLVSGFMHLSAMMLATSLKSVSYSSSRSLSEICTPRASVVYARAAASEEKQ